MSSAVNGNGETRISSIIPDPLYPNNTIDVLVSKTGQVVLREYSKVFVIPNHLAEEISSAIYVAWESSDDVVAAYSAASEATRLAEQAKKAVLEKIARGGRP